MKPAIKRLNDSLFATTDGLVAHRKLESLFKHASKGDLEAKTVLAEYAMNGRLDHIREHTCSLLAEMTNEEDDLLTPLFESGLDDEAIRYWSILGYSRSQGKDACNRLSSFALDESLSTEDRAHAVKCLCSVSDQVFDRQLPSDPGEWDVSDIRTDEISSWIEAGYSDGDGHTSPIRHPTLDEPTTPFEKIVSRFDKRLAKMRSKDQDVADPTNWLTVADENELAKVTSRWELPSVYLDFLTRFSPVKITLANKRYWNGGLRLFGVEELIGEQDGYAFNPVKKRAIRNWPKGYVVIASHGGDPFVLDLSSSDGIDAPVLTAEHGTGAWDFDEVAESFTKFLRAIIK